MSELHAVQETRGSKCVSIWEKQSGGLFRSECSIAPLCYNTKKAPFQRTVLYAYFFLLCSLDPHGAGCGVAAVVAGVAYGSVGA